MHARILSDLDDQGEPGVKRDAPAGTRRRLRRRVIAATSFVAAFLVVTVVAVDEWQCCPTGNTSLGITADALAVVMLGAWIAGMLLIVMKKDLPGLVLLALTALGGFVLSVRGGLFLLAFVAFSVSQVGIGRSAPET